MTSDAKASDFCRWLEACWGRLAEGRLPHASMLADGHAPHPLREEGLRRVMPELRFPASSVQALSVSKQRKRPS